MSGSMQGVTDSTGEDEPRAPVPPQTQQRTRHGQGGADWVLSCGGEGAVEGHGVQAQIYSTHAGFCTNNSDSR